MIKMKAIKPAPFKAQEFERWFTWATKQTLDMAEKELGKTHRTWNHQPHWTKTISVTMREIKGEYLTDDKIYTWVSDGTSGPYSIPKTGTALLAFPSGYTAKTTPKTLFSKSGGSYGPTVFARKVMHPGIKARKFDETAAKFVEPWFKKYGDTAMKQAAKASGHAI